MSLNSRQKKNAEIVNNFLSEYIINPDKTLKNGIVE